MNIPTDLEILEKIYEKYLAIFESYDEKSSTRNSKMYVPIDIDLIGKDLGVDGDLIFGRLYYHFNNKHSYKQDDGTKVELFAKSLGPSENVETNCIQFAYMSSILADLKNENRKFLIATRLAVISLIVSILSITLSILLN